MAINIQCLKNLNDNNITILEMKNNAYTNKTIDTIGDCGCGCGCNCNCGKPFHKNNEELQEIFNKIYSSLNK